MLGELPWNCQLSVGKRRNATLTHGLDSLIFGLMKTIKIIALLELYGGEKQRQNFISLAMDQDMSPHFG